MSHSLPEIRKMADNSAVKIEATLADLGGTWGPGPLDPRFGGTSLQFEGPNVHFKS